MTVKVKICGITRRVDAEAAVEAGADFLGFNFYPGSPRRVNPSLARAILAELTGPVVGVGVFVNFGGAQVREMSEAAGVGLVQLHGDESPDFCAALGRPVIKAFRAASEEDLKALSEFKVWAALVDAPSPGYGGSGIQADWGLARAAKAHCSRLILAGGLTPENVAQAVSAVRPWAVDVASGVESAPGIKDPEKMRRFIEAAKHGSG